MKPFLFSQPKNDQRSGGASSGRPPLPWQLPPHPQIEFTASAEPESTLPKPLSRLCLALVVIALSALSYYAVSRYVLTGVIVQGGSMLPTLHDGDRLLLNRLVYHYRRPERGEIVVIKDPGHTDYAVKRIVGLPLDSIRLKSGSVYLNDKLFPEPYLANGMQTQSSDGREHLFMIGKDRYFLLGDNRGISEDSRYYGSIRRENVVGLIKD